MKGTLSLGAIVVALGTVFASAQSGAPGPVPPPEMVHWSVAQGPYPETVRIGQPFSVIVGAKIEPGWHLYAPAQRLGGPTALAIGMPKAPVFSMAGPSIDPPARTQFDPHFNVDTRLFENTAVFTVPVNLAPGTVAGHHALQVNVEYQTCNVRLCRPPTVVELKLDVEVLEESTYREADPSLAVLWAAKATLDPVARVDALERVRTEFAGQPAPENFDSIINEVILRTLCFHLPHGTDALEKAFDRATRPEGRSRLKQLVGSYFQHDVILELIDRKLLLDRIEQALLSSIGATQAAEAPGDETNPGFYEPLGFGLARLGYVAFAAGSVEGGRAWFQKAFHRAPRNGDVAAKLMGYYLEHDDAARAEETARALSIALPGSEAASGAAVVQAEAESKRGQFAKAEGWLREAVSGRPRHTDTTMGVYAARAMLGLARLERKRGGAAAATLDLYMRVAGTQGIASTGITDADKDAMRALYREIHGSDAGLDGRLDDIARATHPIKPERYTSTAARTTRTVLLEQFTGSGCPPCVADDLALDAVRHRYRPSDVVILAYHVNAPQPDPMAVSAGGWRRSYYDKWGVPSTMIDGTIDVAWGERREFSAIVYAKYIAAIDKALETAVDARVNVGATVQGDVVRVRATVSGLPASARNCRLHLVLAERELSYAAQNGMRLHPMVVRAVAGDKGSGLPISADGAVEFTFSLTAIRDDVTTTLAADIGKRRSRPTPAAGARKVFYGEHHAMSTIDSSQLAIAAFVQDGSRHVLQAAQADVVVERKK